MAEFLRFYILSCIWGLLTTAAITDVIMALVKVFCKRSNDHGRSQQTHKSLYLDKCKSDQKRDREYAVIARKIEDLMKEFEEKVSEQARNDFLETANHVKRKYGRDHQHFKILKSNWVNVKEKLVMESLRN